MVMTLIFRVWLVIRAADRNLTPFVAARGSSRPARPLQRRDPNPNLPTLEIRFLPRHENSSFRPNFGRPDFWPNLHRKRRESRDLLRSIATYDVKEPVLPSKSSA